MNGEWTNIPYNYDLSEFNGISFHAKSDTKLSLKFYILDNWLNTHHWQTIFVIEPSSDWQVFKLPFTDFIKVDQKNGTVIKDGSEQKRSNFVSFNIMHSEVHHIEEDGEAVANKDYNKEKPFCWHFENFHAYK